ncbi:HDOD domain-containing protein [Marinobacterium weihaiense]|uniref:HDOD domain-containing protein n=1 Tax=Marinobacterium weihaiense TaxID=2851016 RepID=A0ABS6ME47_9GAMM|nr:HDOD domain-containing protein [Marinobacterium weihaiense]MBV0934106.1 HDOD domain-containing protein [Marinobacterium weihaiense]
MGQSQPTPPQPLHGIDAWADYLEHRPLPVRASVLARFKRLLASDRTTLQQLTQLVSSDPVLSLHVTRLAQQRHAEKGTSVTGIQHAVGSIGLETLINLGHELTSLKVNPTSMQQKMYFRAIADSLHASWQSAELCRQRGLPFVEEVRLAALLYGCIHWLAWLHAPLHKQRYQERVLLKGVDVALAEADIFGCTLQSLGAELSRRWRLPPLTIEALNHATSPDRKALQQLHRRALQDPSLGHLEQRDINQLTQQRFFPVKLGNWLALTTTRSWQTDKAARLIDIIADYLSSDPDRVRAGLRRHCAEAARCYHVAGTLSPASEMIMLPSASPRPLTGLISDAELKQLLQGQSPRPEVPLPKAKAKPEPARPAPAAPPRQEPAPVETLLDPHCHARLLARLTDPEQRFDKPAQVLHLLLQAIQQGLGLERQALFLIKPGQQTLYCAHGVGLSDNHPLRGVKLNLAVPSLFKRLSERPAGIWLHARNRKALGNTLPESFTACLDGGDYALMSVFQRNRPLAVVYADSQPGHPRLSNVQFEHFKALCAAATQAMRRVG